ncbi:spore germination protein [Bacillaceae bacterium]
MIRSFRKAKRSSEFRRLKRWKEWEEQKLQGIKQKLSKDLEANLRLVREILGESDDLVIRRFHIGGRREFMAALVYIDGLTDKVVINDFILRPAMIEIRESDPNQAVSRQALHNLLDQYGVTINEVDEAEDMQKVIRSVLSGDSALFIEENEKALLLNTKGWDHRGVEEPSTEAVVRGPRDGFTETLRVNTAQIRRRLRDPDLRVKNMTVGKRTNTDIALMYIEGLVDQEVLQEVERRINRIDIDAALESGYIEQFIEDNHWSPFPQIQNTERPDKAAANLLEGKVVIVVDSTPFVLIAPAVFSQFYHSPEDYYERFWIGTFVRFIRVLSMLIALLAPSIYIAFSSFHPEMIPSKLVIAMAAGRSTVPFPSIVEALMMEITVEILREASVRLPGPIGPTIGIVGALVVGQAAVQAGIVSPIMVITVAITTIGSFASPSYNAAIALRLLRFPMMLMAAMFGLYGIMLLLLLIILHLASLKSFGVPYLAPFSPSRLTDMKDTFIRAPLNWMIQRPEMMKPQDQTRMEFQNQQEEQKGAPDPGPQEQPDQSKP